jgi:hypothetical protein
MSHRANMMSTDTDTILTEEKVDAEAEEDLPIQRANMMSTDTDTILTEEKADAEAEEDLPEEERAKSGVVRRVTYFLTHCATNPNTGMRLSKRWKSDRLDSTPLALAQSIQPCNI